MKNRQILKTCPFEDYLKLPGWSHSGIKNEGRTIVPTKKMRLGTLVHQYVNEPDIYNGESSDIVVPVGNLIKREVGPLFHYLTPEFVVLADFIHNGFLLKYKGRIDLGIVDRIVIDIKVTEQPIEKGMEYFHYENPMSGYAAGIGAKAALIVAAHPKQKKVELKNVPITQSWWEYQITQKGEPIL